MFPNFEKYQGPALYVWNDAVFEKKDWYSLAKISDSSKKDDVSKAGRFGLGFQSVFHITGTCILKVLGYKTQNRIVVHIILCMETHYILQWYLNYSK